MSGQLSKGRFYTFEGEPRFVATERGDKNDIVRGYERAASNGVTFIGSVAVWTTAGLLNIDVAFLTRRSEEGKIVFDGLIANGNKLKKAMVVFLDNPENVALHSVGTLSYYEIALGVDIEVTGRARTKDIFRKASGEGFITPIALTSDSGSVEVAFAPTALVGTADGPLLDGVFANGNKLGRASLKMIGDKGGRFMTQLRDAI